MDPIEQANFTPLPHTVAIGDHATVLFLLETGADPEQRDIDGRSALTLAVQNGHLKSVAYLLEYGANPDAIDGTGKSPIQLAKENGLTDALSLLAGAAAEVHKHSDKVVSPKWTFRKPQHVRHRSRWSTARTLMLWLVGAGVAFAAIEMRSSFVSDASQTIFDSITKNNVSQVSRLLVNGVNPNIRDVYGNSAMLYAANSGRMDIVRLLLKNKADPNLGTSQGIAALKRSGMEHEEIVSALLNYGADPNRVDDHGRTLLSYACSTGRYPALITVLLKHKANPNVAGEYGPPLVSLVECGDETHLDSIKALLAAGANPNATDTALTPIIVWSAKHSSAAILTMLLDYGAKISSVDSGKRSALEAACLQERPEIVQLLLDHGGDPNAKDKEGNTSVMYTVSGLVDGPQEAASNCETILRLLSQHGAKLDVTNSSGQTPSQFAGQLGFDQIARRISVL